MPLKKSKAVLIRPYLFEKDYNTIDIDTLSNLLYSIFSPVFDIKDEIYIVYRFINNSLKSNFINNYFQRLKFSKVSFFDLGTDEDCADTEFLIISTGQYSACVIFDFSLSEDNKNAVFCSYLNAKQTGEILRILLPDEKFPPERRENIEINKAFLNIIKFGANSIQESNYNEAEKNNLESITQTLKRDEYLAQKSRYISHEIKNHLSIIDIYSKIIEKSSPENKNIQKGTALIFKSISGITKLLQELKTFNEAELNVYNLSDLLDEAVNFTEEMAKSKDVKIIKNYHKDLNVVLDKDKFQNVILNLIKNGTEAFENSNITNKYIEITSQIKEEKISLLIKNNGNKIDEAQQSSIFEEGFTTKPKGSGLGLYICKQNLKEQFCDLTLIKSDDKETVFEILINKI